MAVLKCDCGEGYDQTDDENILYAYSKKDYLKGDTQSIANRIEIYICKNCGRMLFEDNKNNKTVHMMNDPLCGKPLLYERDKEVQELNIVLLSVEIMQAIPGNENKTWNELTEEEQNLYTAQASKLLEKFVFRLR